jgi:hypothetical protein
MEENISFGILIFKFKIIKTKKKNNLFYRLAVRFMTSPLITSLYLGIIEVTFPKILGWHSLLRFQHLAPPKRTEMFKSKKGKSTKNLWECKICHTQIEGCSEWRRHQTNCEKLK